MKLCRHTIGLVVVCAMFVGCSTETLPDETGTQTSSEASSAAMSVSSSSLSAASSASSVAQSVPANVLLDVPFASQAPFANWDALHEETCEEMSLIMVKHFWDKTPLSEAQSETELQDLVSWMTQQGYEWDVNAEQIAAVAQDRYGLKATVDTDVTLANIKKHLAAGHPIIIPAAGRELGNPYFSGEGPWYHMLVIIGYKDGMFGTTLITNDPGTKRGHNYEYAANTVINAIHDWTGVKEEIATGRKAMVIVTP